MLATDKEVSKYISSLVLISGIFDLEPLRHSGMNRVLGLDPEMVARHSPLYLSPQDKPAVTLAVGENESTEFHRQTNELAAAWDVFTPVLREIDRRGEAPEAYAFFSQGPAGAAGLAARRAEA